MAGTVTVRRAVGALSAEAFDVQRGVLTLPRIGAWTADLFILGSVNLAGSVMVEIADLALRGTVFRCRVHEGQTRLRLVAGADGLRKLARPKHYVNPNVHNVLSDLLGDSGEALSPTADAGALDTGIQAWTSIAVQTGVMVAAAVAQLPEIAWRHAPDGGVWVGKETWPDSGFTDDTFREINEDPENAVTVYGLDEPTLLPGTLIDGNKADLVEHTISADTTRTRVWTVP